jgi:hypothetical protein
MTFVTFMLYEEIVNTKLQLRKIVIMYLDQGIARTQSPTNKNYALDSPTFGAIAGFSPTVVQWKGLDLEKLPSGSKFSPCQVSMIAHQRAASYVNFAMIYMVGVVTFNVW